MLKIQALVHIFTMHKLIQKQLTSADKPHLTKYKLDKIPSIPNTKKPHTQIIFSTQGLIQSLLGSVGVFQLILIDSGAGSCTALLIRNCTSLCRRGVNIILCILELEKLRHRKPRTELQEEQVQSPIHHIHILKTSIFFINALLYTLKMLL